MNIWKLTLLIFLLGFTGMMAAAVYQNIQSFESQQRAQDEQAARERAKHPNPWTTREGDVTTYNSEAYLKSQKR